MSRWCSRIPDVTARRLITSARSRVHRVPVFAAFSIFEEVNEDANLVQKHVASTRNYIPVIASAAKQSMAPRGDRWIASLRSQ